MAYIAISDTTSSSVKLYLGGLDTSWNGGTRTANWTLWNGDITKTYNGHTIANGVSSSSVITISGLEPDTEYSVTCRVYHGSTLLATISGYVTTDYAEPESPWNAWQEEQFDLTTDTVSVDIYNHYSGDYLLEPYNVHRYTATFAYSGWARFYTDSNINTYGELGEGWDGYEWNSEYSGALYPVASDNNSGDGNNFCIEYYVTAGEEYNIFVRGYTGTERGWCTLYIEPPTPSWTHTLTPLGKISSDYSLSAYIGTYTLKIYQMSFATSGVATFSTSGSLDTKGYLNTVSNYDTSDGEPSSYLAYDDDAGSGNNFSFSYNVKAGTTYYLFVRCYDASSSGTVTVSITAPEEVTRPNNFSWTYSKVQGGTFNLTATEWNNLAKRINEFRAYKGLSNYSFNTAYSGNNYTAYMYNQARLAIQGISGYGTYIPTVSSGDTVTAYAMNILVSELNSIP